MPRLAAAALGAVVALLAGCTYVFLPVDVHYDKLSPPYVLKLVNDTNAPVDVLPTREGAKAGHPRVTVKPGDSFSAVVQLRRFTVGAGSSVHGAQLVETPYVQHVSANLAEMSLEQARPRWLRLSLGHPSWFDAYSRTERMPAQLIVPLGSVGIDPFFSNGPE
jgi:hypothetical protein